MTGPNTGMSQSKLQNSQLNFGARVCCNCSIIGPRGTKIEPKMTLCKRTDLCAWYQISRLYCLWSTVE